VVRLVLEIDTGVDCSVGIYEVPTVIAPGTELIAYNLNRNGDPSMNSVPAVYHTPEVSAAGTLAAPVAYVTAALPVDILYQGTMGDVGAGDAAHGTLPEIYLDRTKKYLVRVTNIGTGAGNTVVAGRLNPGTELLRGLTMSESFASRFMSPDEKRAMIARDPQSAQALHNGPRTGVRAQLFTPAGSGCSSEDDQEHDP